MTVMEEAMRKAEEREEEREKAKNGVDVKPAGLALRIPTIKKIETIAVEQEAIDKAVADARQYLTDILDHMAGLVARIRGIQAASSEERTIRSKELKALEDEVLAHLSSGEELLANAARQAYALAMVSTLPLDKRIVMQTIKSNGSSRLPGLLDLKILVEPVGDTKNAVTVKVYGNTYKVGGSKNFAIKLVRVLATGASRAAKAAHELYHDEVVVLKAQATISIAELKSRKIGRIFLDVSDLKEGERFLPGGSLLAESDGKTVKIIQACGHFRHVMTEMAEAGTFVPVESLGHERMELVKRLPEDAFRRVRILHAVLRRGIAEARAKKK